MAPSPGQNRPAVAAADLNEVVRRKQHTQIHGKIAVDHLQVEQNVSLLG